MKTGVGEGREGKEGGRECRKNGDRKEREECDGGGNEWRKPRGKGRRGLSERASEHPRTSNHSI